MVFSVRYSNADSLAFWQPYAKEVWDIEYSQEFDQTCRVYFFSTARPHITEISGLNLYETRYRDLVGPLFRHAIIPAYALNDVARWFAKHLHAVRDFLLNS